MSNVIQFWEGAHADRIRPRGTGEQNCDAQIIILPCVRRSPMVEPPKPKPKRRSR